MAIDDAMGASRPGTTRSSTAAAPASLFGRIAARLGLEGAADALTAPFGREVAGALTTPPVVLQYDAIAHTADHVARDRAVAPDVFAAHLRRLGKRHTIVHLGAAAARIAGDETLPSRAVAITLAGGTLDQYRYAFPALCRAGLSATVFLPPAVALAEDKLRPEDVWPLSLCMTLSRARALSPVIDAFGLDHTRAWTGHDVFAALAATMTNATEKERRTLHARLARLCKTIGLPGLPDARPILLRPAHLAEMAAHGINFGLDARWLPHAATADAEALAADLRQAKRQLEATLGAPICTLLRPHLAHEDDRAGSNWCTAAQSAGFVAALRTGLGECRAVADAAPGAEVTPAGTIDIATVPVLRDTTPRQLLRAVEQMRRAQTRAGRARRPNEGGLA